MHAPNAARTECGVGKKAGNQKEKRVRSKKIVRDRIGLPQRNDYTHEPDHGQAHAHHRGGNGEDVNANILLELPFLIGFGFHGMFPSVSIQPFSRGKVATKPQRIAPEF
jgi:hypothetical protein